MLVGIETNTTDGFNLNMHIPGDVAEAMITGLLTMMLVASFVTLATFAWAQWGPGAKKLSLVGAIKKHAVYSAVVVGVIQILGMDWPSQVRDYFTQN